MQLFFMTMSLATLLIAGLVTSSALPLPSSASAPAATFAGYEMVIANLSGIYNGHDYNLQGDVQAVAAQLESLYGPNESTAKVKARTPAASNKNGIICIPVPGQDWNYANVPATTANINTLNSIGGRIGINGKQCARLACSGNSGIWICNDNNYVISPALTYLATYAVDIDSRCLQTPPFSVAIAGGQEFDSDNYNVIVHDASC